MEKMNGYFPGCDDPKALRNEMIAYAMSGILSNPNCNHQREVVARCAIDQAEALLQAMRDRYGDDF